MPDYDMETKLDSYIDNDKRRHQEEDEKRAFEAQENRRLAQRKEAQDKYNLTEEGMQEVEKLMTEKYIGNYDVAAGHLVATRAASSPPTYDQQYWNHHKQDGYQEIAKDPEAWGRVEL